MSTMSSYANSQEAVQAMVKQDSVANSHAKGMMNRLSAFCQRKARES